MSPRDGPHRFGNRHLLGFDPGRTDVAVTFPEVTIGATTKNEWWGPGIRNAIVMSSNAAGVPRLYLQTAKPIGTPAGALSARLVSGTLTQSLVYLVLATWTARRMGLSASVDRAVLGRPRGPV